MGFDKIKMKQIRNLVFLIAGLILLLMYSELVYKGGILFIKIMKPFLMAGVVAFVINIPMSSIENLLFKNNKRKFLEAAKRPISMVSAFLAIIFVILIVILTVVPQITDTVNILAQKIPVFFENSIDYLQKLSKDYPIIQEQVLLLENVEIDWKNIVVMAGNFLKSGLSNVLTSTVTVASSIIGGIVNVVITTIFSIYILTQKEKLGEQGKRIISAYCNEKIKTRILEILTRLNHNFNKFVCGQCIEAVILGFMFFVSMTILGMPYAVMVGTLIAFMALIPIVGAFIGCFVGAFVICIENPIQALIFIILFLVLQQIEGNIIYPRVVGSSVGLPSIWVLLAVSVGGSLFGVAGMLLFIPLLATVYSFLRDDVNERNQLKEEKSLALKEAKEQNENSINKV